MVLTPKQVEAAAEIASRRSRPTLDDAVTLCDLEGSKSVQRLFELHELLLSRWTEKRDNILSWWS